MQIVLKSTPEREGEIVAIVEAAAARHAPGKAARIERVFPAGTRGNRGRMFTVTIPGISEDALPALMQAIRDSGAAEYVERPAPKSPM